MSLRLTQLACSAFGRAVLSVCIVCGFPRYARKTAHERWSRTMLPQAKTWLLNAVQRTCVTPSNICAIYSYSLPILLLH
jgi:hypothetical protein